MRFPIVIELDVEVDGRYIAEVKDIPGCLAYGDTPELAVRSVLEIAQDQQ